MTAQHKIDVDILSILANSAIFGNNISLPPGQLDRKVYESVDKVLTLMGGKWNRKSRTHVFNESPVDLMDTVLLTGEITDKKKLFQFFETPRALAERMVQLAELDPSDSVMEPSAGRGAILHAIGNNIEKIAVDLDPQNVVYLRQLNMNRLLVFEGDFLELHPNTLVDAVIMNPPFTRGQDVKHILHARQFLNTGGRLVAICADGPLQQAVLEPIAVIYERLSEGTFLASGTNVNTALVVI